MLLWPSFTQSRKILYELNEEAPFIACLFSKYKELDCFYLFPQDFMLHLWWNSYFSVSVLRHVYNHHFSILVLKLSNTIAPLAALLYIRMFFRTSSIETHDLNATYVRSYGPNVVNPVCTCTYILMCWCTFHVTTLLRVAEHAQNCIHTQGKHVKPVQIQVKCM